MKKNEKQPVLLLAADIGNSSITIGYFRKNSLLVQRIPTHPLQKAGQYRSGMEGFLGCNRIEKKNFPCIISSVVPGCTQVFRKAVAGLSGATVDDVLVVGPEMETGLGFSVPAPRKLGSDRIANAVAAWTRYRKPVAVVDCGTATTISVVGRDAVFLGGAILPGFGLMNRTLSSGAAKLSAVALAAPAAALGRDTESCIQSGIVFGSAGAVERILGMLERECGSSLRVALTGGFGELMHGQLRKRHDLLPDLTLEGLRILYGKNRPA